MIRRDVAVVMLYEASSGAPPNRVIGYAEHYKIVDAEHALCVDGLSCGDLFGIHTHSSAFLAAPIKQPNYCFIRRFGPRFVEQRSRECSSIFIEVYLWRAVDAEGEVLDVLVQTRRAI